MEKKRKRERKGMNIGKEEEEQGIQEKMIRNYEKIGIIEEEERKS